MRLTFEQQSALRDALRRSFGKRARLWLFGSRVDDRARGGDHDLLVQTDEADAAHLIDARLGFLADLHATPAFEDERLDAVLYAPALDPQPRPIHPGARVPRGPGAAGCGTDVPGGRRGQLAPAVVGG